MNISKFLSLVLVFSILTVTDSFAKFRIGPVEKDGEKAGTIRKQRVKNNNAHKQRARAAQRAERKALRAQRAQAKRQQRLERSKRGTQRAQAKRNQRVEKTTKATQRAQRARVKGSRRNQADNLDGMVIINGQPIAYSRRKGLKVVNNQVIPGDYNGSMLFQNSQVSLVN